MNAESFDRMAFSGKTHAPSFFPLMQGETPLVPFDQQTAGGMKHLINRRSAPGIIILGREGPMLFSGGTSEATIRLLKSEESEGRARRFNKILRALRIQILAREALRQTNQAAVSVEQFHIFQKKIFLFRGFLLSGNGEEHLVMVMIEHVTGERQHMKPSTEPYDFTPRERSVLHFIRKGCTNKEIANALSISTYTIKDHLRRIMKKLNVHTRSGVVGKMHTA